MAKITREMKMWSEQTGVSHHIGIEVDTVVDLGLTPDPTHAVAQLTIATELVDRLLISYIQGHPVNFGYTQSGVA